MPVIYKNLINYRCYINIIIIVIIDLDITENK